MLHEEGDEWQYGDEGEDVAVDAEAGQDGDGFIDVHGMFFFLGLFEGPCEKGR